jgi:cellulose synthase/poly-beta-1,6-N-acetylglucosamine synthase-like glycosyltransferase
MESYVHIKRPNSNPSEKFRFLKTSQKISNIAETNQFFCIRVVNFLISILGFLSFMIPSLGCDHMFPTKEAMHGIP